jgi:type II secretory pathway predicted ATPase ExeA
VSGGGEGAELFPIAADPESYVQTAAAEDALEALCREVRGGRAPAALVGVAGVGKTLILRVLERRLGASFRVVYLHFAALPVDELCNWILGLLGESAGREPERDLLAAGLRLERAGSPLVVILDDAGSMAVTTARRLSALFVEAGGAIRLVLGLAEDARSDQVVCTFHPPASRVELRTLMSREETARYLRAQLVRSEAPQAIRACFDPTTIRHLHYGSGGVPRVLNGLASELVRGHLAISPRREAAARRQPLGFATDPFDVTSDPAAYVPRQATQELLESIETALRRGARAVAVTGPPGLGKTMLLRVLERRLRSGFQAVRVSYTALPPDELCRWILALLGDPAPENGAAGLLELAGRLERVRTALVLLLDDASAIPITTARRLAELAGEARGAMRVVLFAIEDARTPRILDALGSGAVRLRLTEPMSEEETARYIRARLDHASAPKALAQRFDAATVARLYRESGGIPREIHKLAAQLYREGDSPLVTRPPPPELARAPARSEPHEPPTPPAPSDSGAPKREATPAREPPSGRRVAFGLLVLAILLAAIPLLRAGFPWWETERGAEPVVEPPAGAPPPEAPAPPPPAESVEPIAVDVDATPWASVEVDGEYLGVTPLAGVLLPPGPHVFRARMPNGEIREHRVEVRATMRQVLFYAEPAAEKVEPEPRMAPVPAPPPRVPEALPEMEPRTRAAPAPRTPVPEDLPKVTVEPPRAPREKTPEIRVAPKPVTSPRKPEPAPSAAVPGPVASRRAVEPAPPARVPEPVAASRKPEPVPQAVAPEPVSVSINATPWAVIEIDGKEIGETPMSGILLAPGDHRFRARMPDGTVMERTIRIAPDNRHIAFAR